MSTKPRYIALLLSAFLAFQVSADTLTLRKDHPEHYVVRKGDTLWDISGRFLTKPWQWPRLWNLNKQIADPHWIYPGDRLRLTWVNGSPRLEVENRNERYAPNEGKRVIKLTPRVRVEEKQAPIPVVELSEIAQFLRADMVVDMNVDLENVPYVLGESDDTSIYMSQGQSIQVRGKPNLNQRYGIYHVGNTYKDEKTDEELGRQLELVAIAQPTQLYANNTSSVEIVTSYSEVRKGDRLLPLRADNNLDAYFTPQPGQLTTPGTIIDVPMKTTYVGRYDTVIIDKGQRDHVQPGDVFSIVRPGADVVDEGPDKVTYKLDQTDGEKLISSGSVTQLQADQVGEVMIIKAYNKTSLAIVMNSRAIVRAGFKIENP